MPRGEWTLRRARGPGGRGATWSSRGGWVVDSEGGARNSPYVTQETFWPTKTEQSVTIPNPGTPKGRTSFVIPQGGCQMKMQGDSSGEIKGTPQSPRGSQCGSVHTKYRTQKYGGRSHKHRIHSGVHRQV
jgi:hypothetical protein